MQKQLTYRLALEFTWWVITAVIVWAVLAPIYKSMNVWPFVTWNVINIITVVTLARHIFFMEHTFIAKRQNLKIVLLLLMFPATFLFMEGVSDFMTYIGEHSWDAITGHLPPTEKRNLETYIWNEMLFFGVGSVLTAPIFAARMMMSIWRTRNRGTY